MPRKSSTRAGYSIFGSVVDWLDQQKSASTVTRRGGRRRQLGYESLEGRVVLSAVPGGVIDGTVTNSQNNQPLAGVTIQLTPTGGSTQSTLTNASGFYSFSGLAAGTYSVQEILPTGFTGPVNNPATVVITTTQANDGVVASDIDTFATAQTVTASSNGPTSAANSIAAAEALGGNRDLIADLTSGVGNVSLNSNEFGQGNLEFDSSASGVGDRIVRYDGPNSATPSVLNPTGLDHADLTDGGTATGISLTLGGDHAGGSITINVYKDANDWSTATIAIPNTGGTPDPNSPPTFIPFSAFTIGAGTGAGNFTDVGAVEMQIIGGPQAANGEISTIALVGPAVTVTNFSDTPQVDLQVTKTDSVGGSSVTSTHGTVLPGTPFTYTITVTNNGPAAVTGATVADTFPNAGVNSFLATNYTVTPGAGASITSTSHLSTGINDLVTMASGSSITYVVTGTPGPGGAGTLSNTATITAPVGVIESNPNNNTAIDIDNLTPTVDLSVTKTDNVGGSSVTGTHGTVVPGTAFTYTITVTNSGPSTVTGATVQDTFPNSGANTFSATNYTVTPSAGASITSTSHLSTGINDTVTMTPGSTITYVVTGTPGAGGTGTLSNTVTVTPPVGVNESNRNNNTATDIDALVPNADLTVTKTDSVGGSSVTGTHGTVIPGTAFTYTITVTNNGPAAVTGATVLDTFPNSGSNTFSATNYVVTPSAGASITSTSHLATGINDTVTMAVGSTITYVVTGTPGAGGTGTLSNTVTVTPPAGVTDPTPANNTAIDIDALVPNADLKITKTDSVGGSSVTSTQGTVVPGTPFTYTITVTNSGPAAVTGATVQDTFPNLGNNTFTATNYVVTPSAGASITSTSHTGTAINDTVTMASGSTITYVVTGTPGASGTGTMSNTATVTVPAGVTDPTPANNTATDVDDLAPGVDLKITKVDNVGGSSINSTTGTAFRGGTLTYTVVVTNVGPSTATGASVTDSIPTSLTNVAFTASSTGGASGFSATGTGSINDTVNMPSGSTITYKVTATVPFTATGTLTNNATVTDPQGVTDPTPNNNSASDPDVVATRLSKAFFLGR